MNAQALTIQRSDAAAGRHPACPITGEPALRRIQTVGTGLLAALWRIAFGVDATALLGHVERLGLWESPCGLAFFDPMIAGDATFYDRVYGRMQLHTVLAAAGVVRPEFNHAAALVPHGAKLLDVGAGEGGFARHVPHAVYRGLDQSAPAETNGIDLRRETIAEHAATHAGGYDVACALQVVEHVAEPLGFVADMVTCLRPGGRLILGLPIWPSPMTDIPNFVFNAPPHHLTWWTEGALRALCAQLHLEVESIAPVRHGTQDGILYWMGRCSPKLTGERFFRAKWGWYAALAWAWVAGRIANALLKPAANAAPLVLVLSARKAG